MRQPWRSVQRLPGVTLFRDTVDPVLQAYIDVNDDIEQFVNSVLDGSATDAGPPSLASEALGPLREALARSLARAQARGPGDAEIPHSATPSRHRTAVRHCPAGAPSLLPAHPARQQTPAGDAVEGAAPGPPPAAAGPAPARPFLGRTTGGGAVGPRGALLLRRPASGTPAARPCRRMPVYSLGRSTWKQVWCDPSNKHGCLRRGTVAWP